MWFPNFPLNMQFFQVFLHYFFTTIFWIPACFYLNTWIFLNPSSKTTSFIHISIVSLFPLITFSFVEDCSIDSFHKTMSKDNVENDYSSTNYAKIIIKFVMKRKKKRKKAKKMHLQTNGFKGLEKTFTNNGV